MDSRLKHIVVTLATIVEGADHLDRALRADAVAGDDPVDLPKVHGEDRRPRGKGWRWKRGMQVAATQGGAFLHPVGSSFLLEVLPAPRRVGPGLFQKVENRCYYPCDKSQMCFQVRRFATPLMTAGDTLNLRASTARGVPAALAARICLTF
jgi:hypothetical protein